MHKYWFKSLSCLRYNSKHPISQALWEPKLNNLIHRPIKPSFKSSMGFSPVLGFLSEGALSHQLGHYLFISMTVEIKKIPKNKLKREVALRTRERIKSGKIKEEDLNDEQRAQIQSEVELELIKGVIPDETYINAILDLENKLLFVDTVNAKVVESLKGWLCRIDDTMKFKPIVPDTLEIFLTQWVYKPETIPPSVSLEEDATLVNDNSAKAVFSKQHLDSEELITLINHNKKVTELSITLNHRLCFKLRSDGLIRKINITDTLHDEIDFPEEMELVIQEYEANWESMTKHFTSLYFWITDVFEIEHLPFEESDENKNTNTEDEMEDKSLAVPG